MTPGPRPATEERQRFALSGLKYAFEQSRVNGPLFFLELSCSAAWRRTEDQSQQLLRSCVRGGTAVH